MALLIFPLFFFLLFVIALISLLFLHEEPGEVEGNICITFIAIKKEYPGLQHEKIPLFNEASGILWTYFERRNEKPGAWKIAACAAMALANDGDRLARFPGPVQLFQRIRGPLR